MSTVLGDAECGTGARTRCRRRTARGQRPPIEEIVSAAQDPDVAALVLGARGVHGGPSPPDTPR